MNRSVSFPRPGRCGDQRILEVRVVVVFYMYIFEYIFIDGGPDVSYRRLDLLMRPVVLGMIIGRDAGLDVIVELSGTRG